MNPNRQREAINAVIAHFTSKKVGYQDISLIKSYRTVALGDTSVFNGTPLSDLLIPPVTTSLENVVEGFDRLVMRGLYPEAMKGTITRLTQLRKVWDVSGSDLSRYLYVIGNQEWAELERGDNTLLVTVLGHTFGVQNGNVVGTGTPLPDHVSPVWTKGLRALDSTAPSIITNERFHYLWDASTPEEQKALMALYQVAGDEALARIGYPLPEETAKAVITALGDPDTINAVAKVMVPEHITMRDFKLLFKISLKTGDVLPPKRMQTILTRLLEAGYVEGV